MLNCKITLRLHSHMIANKKEVTNWRLSLFPMLGESTCALVMMTYQPCIAPSGNLAVATQSVIMANCNNYEASQNSLAYYFTYTVTSSPPPHRCYHFLFWIWILPRYFLCVECNHFMIFQKGIYFIYLFMKDIWFYFIGIIRPDWWGEQEYKSIVYQIAKMKMNFIGLHTYPLVYKLLRIWQNDNLHIFFCNDRALNVGRIATTGLQNPSIFAGAIGLAQMNYSQRKNKAVNLKTTKNWVKNFFFKFEELCQEYF